MDDSSLWRADLGQTANDLYDEYGADEGWPGVVPFPFSEAIVHNESEGQNLPRNSAGAIGLMQVRADGWESGEFTKATGESVTEDKLTDPAFNMRVGIFGLAQRWMKMNRDAGEKDWGIAGMGYLGAWNMQNGKYVSPNWSTGQSYYNGIYDYIANAPGFDDMGGQVEQNLKSGNWYDRNKPGTFIAGVISDAVGAVDAGRNVIQGTFSVVEWLNGIHFDAALLETIGFAALGLVCITVGVRGAL